MTGLIWFVQIVHYPMFSSVGDDQFVDYEARHQRLTTYVVMPVMLVELATAILLVSMSSPGNRVLPWIGLVLLIIVWLSTWALQVPAHNALQAGFSSAEHNKLVTTNWIRTVAWTGRIAVLCAMIHRLLPNEVANLAK
jgi:uncharacterized membrane protein